MLTGESRTGDCQKHDEDVDSAHERSFHYIIKSIVFIVLIKRNRDNTRTPDKIRLLSDGAVLEGQI
jgi:hypothetical protein